MEQVQFFFIKSLLENLFDFLPKTWKLTVPDRTSQTGSMNCGVFVMWYAYQITHNRSITDPIVPNAFRRYVFQTLAGNCMQRSHFLDDTCKICHNAESFGQWVKCQQCSQRFHCECAGVTFADSLSNKFVCPM